MKRAHPEQAPDDNGTYAWWTNTPITAPAHLRAKLTQAIDDRQYREGRFILFMAFALAVVSLVVDAVAVPQHFAQIATVRLGATLPILLAAYLMPPERPGLFKFLLGLALSVLALTLIYASSLAPAPANAFMALGVIAMIAIAVPIMPLRRTGLTLFVLGTVIPSGVLALVLHRELEFAKTFLTILALVAIGASVLARRMRWLERWSALLTLEAEYRAEQLEQSNKWLTELSMQDPLTNLANRRWAEIAFERDYALTDAEAPGHTALLLLDLDHFKAFNDRWGHDAGDKCLQAVAEVMRHIASTHGGMAARFGGEEFVVVFRADEPSEAMEVAEEVRVGVERIEIDCGGKGDPASTTTSIGIAVHERTNMPDLSSMLKRADIALYQAKRDGRNRHRLAN